MADTESSSASSKKRRRLEFSTNSIPSSNFELEENDNEQRRLISTAISSNSDEGECSGESPCSSVLSGNEIVDVAKSDDSRVSDLESRSFETESSQCIINNKFSTERENTPSSDCCGDTDGMDSPTIVIITRKRKALKSSSQAMETPSQAEIEEFFEAAEKVQEEKRKRFTKKYNYDVVNDLPMEGRYQWFCVKP